MGSPLLASTRARILLAALALLAGTVVLSVIANRALLLARLAERIDEELAQEVDEFQRLAGGTDPDTGEPFGTDVTAIFDTYFSRNVPGAGEVLLGLVGDRPYLRSAGGPDALDEYPDIVSAWVSTTRSTYGEATTRAGDVRWLVVPVTAAGGERLGTFVVARFPAAEREEVDATVRTAAAVGAGAFVVASALAWVIAGRVLAPLRDLAQATRSVREDHLDHRIPVQGSGELAELSRTFNDMLDRVEGAFDAQRAFLDDAGHELRTPITVIRGHLEIADPAAPLGDPTREVVFDELDRMARIVDDLLLIAKAERPDFVVPGPVDVADLTAEVAAKARPLGERDWEVRAGAVLVADLDRERITQGWMNLIRNAVQHTAVRDRITVFSAVVDGALELGVVDTGEGVAAEDRDRIFGRFGRGSSARRTRSDGAGLGLAIVAAVAGAHGGRVDLRDTPGGGATFTMVLPLAGGDAAEPADPEEVPWPGS